jgi:hypothetical protein
MYSEHSAMMGWGMGFGWFGLVFWLVVILGIAALIKYLFFNGK